MGRQVSGRERHFLSHLESTSLPATPGLTLQSCGSRSSDSAGGSWLCLRKSTTLAKKVKSTPSPLHLPDVENLATFFLHPWQKTKQGRQGLGAHGVIAGAGLSLAEAGAEDTWGRGRHASVLGGWLLT